MVFHVLSGQNGKIHRLVGSYSIQKRQLMIQRGVLCINFYVIYC